MSSTLPRSTPSEKGRLAWAREAEGLARWAWNRYFVRRDVWGGYLPLAEREKHGKTCTRPAVARRGKVFLTLPVLVRHFRGERPEDVVGAHTTSLDNQSLFGTVEVDVHGESGNDPAATLRAVLAWHDALRERGFHPLLWDSNGAGGYHLDVLLVEPVSTPRLYRFVRELVRDYARHGLPVAPETFPKQERLRPTPDGKGRYGNWCRLPGRHHTRDHWARVWDGARWLDGAEAAGFMLGLAGDPAALVPDLPPPTSPGRPRRPHAGGPGGNLSARIAAYQARLPNLAEGQGRDAVAYSFACWLARDLDLADEVCLAWLERWDAGNSPPKGRAALAEILANARRYGRSPIGCGRSPAGTGRDRRGHVILTRTLEVW